MDINNLIEMAIAEDVGSGDHTSLSCIPANAIGKAQLLVKEKGVLAGMEVANMVFQRIDKNLIFNPLLKDGDFITQGDIAFTIEGSNQSILKAERIVLNFMQRMSGIATKTNHYIQLIEGFNTKVLDTRKTTPGLRLIEKMAVKIGGGQNHRMGLYDMIMIKDNHIDFAGGIAAAINKTNAYLKENSLDLKIEIEARNLTELDEILAVGNVDIIMLDNFSFEDMRTAVKKINGKYKTEASGGINETTIRAYAACGVDFISVGALTHQINSLDLSLKAI
ncbi:MAG: carboxylating nicotinate-nucleotide diphosphorylase [Flavobacteriales bacterium]|nr:carboxylating nicotinate-nucleotide diphosphorylase [Flavobacteriales bacterium]MCW8912135.1 carboxylating nicotinate-nucleotide diphosphorylase [Flavobacteriales bacterium]MCW8936775.1 carboxylating nicotinate-nucleotide diphosphorylase [Flavobacteriales bacterium]MCW8939063.1 carboxylating nicotinate-nucleotide diphosphorylase [Flavobacteriales bacterium]MCW8968423.1 carboxylating nicotinate-nucleotide diphosphorylase [Flavobacteriales bacterium]